MKKNIISLFLLLVVSSFFIFYLHNEIPKGLTHDENELARTAFSLEGRPYTPFTPIADGHGTPYFYTLLLSFKTFGINQFALRLPSRICGILNILLFYLILKMVFKNKKESILYSIFYILDSLLLLTSRWYLHFARIALETPFLLFTELVSFIFALKYLGNKQNKFIILSGVFAGIAFNSYQPGRIFFLVPLLIFILRKVNRQQILYFLITFLIFITPMSLYLAINPKNDIRINQQFFLKNTELSIGKKAEFLWSNISNTTLMFFTKGDINGQHNYTGKPALNPILALFFLLGILFAIKQWKNFNNLIFLFYFFIAIIPTILTYPWENPNMLRTYTALPAIIYFIGLSFLELYKLIKNKFHRYIILFFILISLFFILSTTYELRTYFKYQPLVFKQSFDKPDYLKIIRQDALKQ